MPTASLASPPLHFTLTSNPVTPAEAHRFGADLGRLGLDAMVWTIMNGTVVTATRWTIPRIIRAYRADALMGVALIFECRKIGTCFFDDPIAAMMDAPRLPMFFWTRNGNMVDQNANVGYVADGLDRDDFVRQALVFLMGRYLYGTVMGKPEPPGRHVSWPAIDTGVVDLAAIGRIEDYLARGKNLRRKTTKFRNRGGVIETRRGALSAEERAGVAHIFTTIKPVLLVPFQDNYVPMALQAQAHADPALVHFIARLDGAIVGYHSFAISGTGLHCLSGAFDRSRTTTYHAYENLIIESIRFCQEQGLTMIHYGPIVNPTKVKMMTGFQRAELRTYSRYPPVRALLPYVFRASKLAHEGSLQYVGLADRRGTDDGQDE